MSVEAMVQKMIDDLTAALVDATKHDKGNSAAGTRVRKAMQEAKATAQAIRVQVQADKNAWFQALFFKTDSVRLDA